MPRYKFKLHDDSGGAEDDFGVNLPNGEIAHRYACDVVRELMDHRERKTRHWRLEVYQDNGEKVFDIPFAKLDQTLDRLRPQQVRAFKACDVTRREARSRGKLYLVVDNGRKVIRVPPPPAARTSLKFSAMRSAQFVPHQLMPAPSSYDDHRHLAAKR